MASDAPEKVVVPFGESHEPSPVEPELSPPCAIQEPDEVRSPLVFSSPHSGNVYPARFLAMEGRFSRPVYPGDELTVSMWVDGGDAVFRTETQRGEVVIDGGRCRFNP